MIDRNMAEQINEYWRKAKDTTRSTGARLEDMLSAFQLLMGEVITDHDAVQRFWESTNLLALTLAAANDQPIDAGASVRKDSLLEYQALHLSFRAWLNLPVTAEMPTGQFDNTGQMIRVPVTLQKTPSQLLLNPPVKAGG